MATSTRSGAKSIANAIAYSFRQMSTTGAIPQDLSENDAANRVRDWCRSEPLSLRAAALCIGALSVIGWVVILVLVLVLV